MAVGIDETVGHLRQMRATQRARAEQRARSLRELVPEAAKLLREQYGATQVWLFGSLATGDVHAGTDVDLAVEGLPSDRYFDALGARRRRLAQDPARRRGPGDRRDPTRTYAGGRQMLQFRHDP